MKPQLHIGTCSWTFDAWRGLVYSGPPEGYLAEYARRYGCVEINHWFWSLGDAGKVVLPKAEDAAGYAAAVPAGFRFGVKLPNALTLTHFHDGGKDGSLVPNPYFLSVDLLEQFMERLEPLQGKLGPLMLQFSYLVREMVPSQEAFLERLDAFVSRLPSGLTWCVEPRNPEWLNDDYFLWLKQRGLTHVWEQGYYMPPLADVYAKHAEQFTSDAVVRMRGLGWVGKGNAEGNDGGEIVEPRDADLDALAGPLKDLAARGKNAWAFVDNRFEGCAPKTIERIRERLRR